MLAQLVAAAVVPLCYYDPWNGAATRFLRGAIGLLAAMHVFGYLHSRLLAGRVRAIGNSGRARTALVTGGGHGIGRQTALRLAAEGYNIVLWDINETLADQTAQLIMAKAPKGLTVFVDKVNVADDAEVQRAADHLQTSRIVVDVLVLNAGIVVGKTVQQTTAAEVQRVFGVNVFQLFNCTRAFLPSMIEYRSEQKQIVVIGSVAGFCGAVRMADYGGSKAAANCFAESLKAEVRLYPHIHVCLVCPWVVNTGMFRGVGQCFGMPAMLDESSVAKAVCDGIRFRKDWVVIPPRMAIFLAMKALLPWWSLPTIDSIIGASKAMDTFEGHTRHPSAPKRS